MISAMKIPATIFFLVSICGSLRADTIYSVDAISVPSSLTSISSIFGLNDSGQVAGVGVNSAGNYLAFIATTSGSTVIPVPTGWASNLAYSINDSGQVSGLGNNGGTDQALIGTGGGSAAIPIPAGLTGFNASLGIGVNNLGQVAGVVYFPPTAPAGGAPSSFQAFIGYSQRQHANSDAFWLDVLLRFGHQ